ncbi:hypothetical protein OGATHE_006699 [Ogataea polymorpha]|uniref:Uncharacterized protein n=1 Tax=Ogataea polymorpha TaxID=460523 RepID=A0A9P8NQ08_9ASCO|nr:hypothetical protein OGATHE_006699 [Ogataea polymorpha]
MLAWLSSSDSKTLPGQERRERPYDLPAIQIDVDRFVEWIWLIDSDVVLVKPDMVQKVLEQGGQKAGGRTAIELQQHLVEERRRRPKNVAGVVVSANARVHGFSVGDIRSNVLEVGKRVKRRVPRADFKRCNLKNRGVRADNLSARGSSIGDDNWERHLRIKQSTIRQDGVRKVPCGVVLSRLVQNVLSRGPIVEGQSRQKPGTSGKTCNISNGRQNRQTMLITAVGTVIKAGDLAGCAEHRTVASSAESKSNSRGSQNSVVIFAFFRKFGHEVVGIEVCHVCKVQEPSEVFICNVFSSCEPVLLLLAQAIGSTYKSSFIICVVF